MNELTIEKLVEEFLTSYRFSLYRHGTELGAKSRLKKLKAYLTEQDLRVEEVNILAAQGFKRYLQEGRKQSLRGSTSDKILQTARVFFNYLVKQGRIEANPFAELVKTKGEQSLPASVPKEKECDLVLLKLEDFLEGKSVRELRSRYRVHVISELQYATGMRLHEVLMLEERDIDFEKGVVTIREAKGGSERKAFLNEYAKEVLKIYIRELRPLVLTGNSNSKRLFGGASHGKCHTLINRELVKAASEAGIKPFTNRFFRHAFGAQFLRAGCDIRFIQELLGHKCLSSTEVYTRIEKEDLKGILDQYHPRQYGESKK
jgi:site-specific recombinase XerD